MRASRHSLLRRLFVVNAIVLIGAFSFFVFTSATISESVVVKELVVVVVAVALSLGLNFLLVRRTLGPLRELREIMRRVDPLRPGERVVVADADVDVAQLVSAFNEMLDRLETERRESARRALRAQEGERIRIARELHDELGQSMTGLLLLVDQAVKHAPAADPETLDEVRELARELLDQVRRIARDLRPETLDDLGLLSALNALATGLAQQTGAEVERRFPDRLPPLTLEQELVVYRVVQEALTNVARHAEAGHVTIELSADAELRVEVSDDGHGFDAAAENTGIRGMRERALLVHGHVDIGSAPGTGTVVGLMVPLHGKTEDDA